MLLWKIRNTLSRHYLKGWFDYHFARFIGSKMGAVYFLGTLSLKANRGGKDEDYGIVGYRVVTTEFVNHLSTCLQGTTTRFTTYKYHALGTGTGDEAVGDTALGTEITDGSPLRGVGTQIAGASANIYKSVSAAITMDATLAITEHGLLSAAYGDTDELMDRTKFAAINVVANDTITPTYQLTCTAGG